MREIVRFRTYWYDKNKRKEIDNKSEGFEIAYEKISHWNISTCGCW